MPTRIYWIHEFSNTAKIGIMPRPRGNEWLEDEIIFFKTQKVDIIISLLEKEEISELSLEQEEALCNKHGITFHHLPIKDRGLPDKSIQSKKFIEKVFAEVMSGLNVVVHCRMGIGRSSIIAGAVILHEGSKTEDIISKIKKVRGLSIPDTDEQLKWLQLQEKNKGR